jgi:hypothetical protein
VSCSDGSTAAVFFFRVGHNGNNSWFDRDHTENKAPNRDRPESYPNRRYFTYGEVDASRALFRRELCRMIWIVRPSIPLNPPDGPILVLDDEDVNLLDPVDPRAVLLLEAAKIERLVPPRIDMRCREPLLQQRKIGSL